MIRINLLSQNVVLAYSGLHTIELELPTQGIVPTTFVNSSIYPKSGEAADKDWKSLFPPGGGFLRPDLDPVGRLYGFSMFHQLHCLNSLRMALESSYGVGSENSHHMHDDKDSFDHLFHCIGYLRQGILCSADGTMEPESEHVKGGVAGVGVVHQCKDKKVMYDTIAQFPV